MGLGLALTEYCLYPVTVPASLCLEFSKPGFYLSGQPWGDLLQIRNCGLFPTLTFEDCWKAINATNVSGSVLLGASHTEARPRLQGDTTAHPHPHTWIFPETTSLHIHSFPIFLATAKEIFTVIEVLHFTPSVWDKEGWGLHTTCENGKLVKKGE